MTTALNSRQKHGYHGTDSIAFFFVHRSHVTMSVVKLLSRIVAPDDVLLAEVDQDHDDHEIRQTLHDHTYGITSDPLTQFAVVMSALVRRLYLGIAYYCLSLAGMLFLIHIF